MNRSESTIEDGTFVLVLRRSHMSHPVVGIYRPTGENETDDSFISLESGQRLVPRKIGAGMWPSTAPLPTNKRIGDYPALLWDDIDRLYSGREGIIDGLRSLGPNYDVYVPLIETILA